MPTLGGAAVPAGCAERGSSGATAGPLPGSAAYAAAMLEAAQPSGGSVAGPGTPLSGSVGADSLPPLEATLQDVAGACVLRGMKLFANQMWPFMQKALQRYVDEEFVRKRKEAGQPEVVARQDAAAESRREAFELQEFQLAEEHAQQEDAAVDQLLAVAKARHRLLAVAKNAADEAAAAANASVVAIAAQGSEIDVAAAAAAVSDRDNVIMHL
jgi:hypothetical protein